MMLLLVPGWAQAGVQVAGYDVETAVYKDLGRRLTIDTAADAHFVPTSATMGLGFDAPLTWLRLTRIRVPGAAGVQVLLRIGPRFNADFASVFILRDEDRFTVFDAYGRPRAMPEGEMFSVGVSGEASGSVVHIFRAGDLVYGTESTNREVAD